MTQAVCFKCGKFKWGAFNHCKDCQATPKTDDELMMSLAFTDHYFELEELQRIGREIKSGRALQFSDDWKAQLAPGVREAKIMLGAGRVARKELAPERRKFSESGRELQTHKRGLSSIFFFVLLFVVTAVIVGSLLDFIPWNIRRYFQYVIIPAGVLWSLWSWFKRYAKRRGDQNELDVLEETVREHERGKHDNTEYIKKQIIFIERDHKPTPAVQRLLERARRAIAD